MRRIILSLLGVGLVGFLIAQNLVSYAGNNGREGFYDIMQLSDGTWLTGGYATDLDWIDSSVPRSELALPPGVSNQNGSNQYGILLHFSTDFTNILRVVHFPLGGVENVRFIKTTNVPGTTTGDIYLSGDTEDSEANNGGYFIARLNGNFVDAPPTAVIYARPVWAEGEIKRNHPWDVGNDGRVVYLRGQTHDYDWSAMYQLDPAGERTTVEHWRTHWQVAGGEYYGQASEHPSGIAALTHSGMVFKRGNRCNFRSQTQAEYEAILPDGNGSTKQGTWPLDAFFAGPCIPGSGPTTGPGYTGYRTGATSVYGPASVSIDRRNNDLYVGMNIKSVLPSGLPDFEPAVIAFSAEGVLRWWSRLYHEIDPDNGSYLNSTPDQYIDALGIDYAQSLSDAALVVSARSHGNNTENFWEGNTLAANPGTTAFQNRFTGTSGNIHLSWLGKLQLSDGTIVQSTYVGEYPEGSNNYGSTFTDINLLGWPNPNSGWPSLNTTRLGRNNLKVTADGSVCVLGLGRRTITTANAHQQMPLPENGETGTWNRFVRVYAPDFSVPVYSSLLTGIWDTQTGLGGNNTELYGIWKTADGVVVVGRHLAQNEQAAGNDIPIQNIPAWGSDHALNESAILAYLRADNLVNIADGPSDQALPVSLIGFQARRISANQVELEWSTDSEQNSYYFALERSVDGQNWREFGQLPATQVSDQIRNYRSKDVDAPASEVFYRLHVVDLDNSYQFGPIREVGPWSVRNDLALFPNPLQGGLLYLQWDQPAEIGQIKVFDLSGRVRAVFVKDETLSRLQLDLSFLPKGSYTIKAIGPQQSWQRRLLRW